MILVTGGAGFIGSHTVRRLRELGHSVRVLDDLSTGRRERLDGLGAELVVGSITSDDDLRRAVDGVDRVVHLAARISVPESVERPLDYQRTNVTAFVQLLEAARRAGVVRVAYASSCAVYGSLPGLPKQETDSVAPESPYAASKLADEAWGAAYSALGLPCVGLRYFNVFGPEQDPGGAYGAVIPKFVERALSGRPLTVFGDGEQGRDFVSVRDVARANAAAALGEGPGGVYNVGTGRMLTVNALAAVVRDLVADVPVEHLPERPGDVRLSCAAASRAAADLGWTAEADFEAALAETVAWFRDRSATQD